MPSNDRDQLTTDPTAGQCQCSSYVSYSLMMYEDGGGHGGSSSGNSSSSGNDDYGSWSDDGISCAGTSASSSGSADEGSYSGNRSSSGGSGDGSSSGGSGTISGGGKRGKWLKSLRTVIDQMVGSKHQGHNCKNRTVKTILRPPTTYKYVIGMSGLPSKVPVYLKTTM